MIDFKQRVRHDIQIAGFTCMQVSPRAGGPPEPSFTYTIGLQEQWGFELLIVALHPHWAGMGLNKMYAIAQNDGIIPRPDMRDHRLFNLPVLYKQTKPDLVRTYVCQADEFYGKPVNVLQVVMCDREGRFDGDQDYDAAYMCRQPKLW